MQSYYENNGGIRRATEVTENKNLGSHGQHNQLD
jgi:hypothetical protein